MVLTYIVDDSLAFTMQHVLTVSTYRGSCKKQLFRIPVFGGKVSLKFLAIDLWSSFAYLAYMT